MIIYMLMITISLMFSLILKKIHSKKLYIMFAILSAIPFVIVSGFRYDVGTDYLFRYVNDFFVLRNGENINNLEIGFLVLQKICILLNNYQVIFIITSLITTTFIFYTIYRDSKNVQLSIVLYFIGAFFFQSLNMVRQYVSISIILFSYKFLINKNWLKWLRLYLYSNVISYN